MSSMNSEMALTENKTGGFGFASRIGGTASSNYWVWNKMFCETLQTPRNLR